MQDTAGSELIHLAGVGFCQDGEQEKLVGEGARKTIGRLPVKTAGRLLANGAPMGTFGLRQVGELVTQLRDRAGNRQVAGARSGYALLYAAPGTAAVTVLWT